MSTDYPTFTVNDDDVLLKDPTAVNAEYALGVRLTRHLSIGHGISETARGYEAKLDQHEADHVGGTYLHDAGDWYLYIEEADVPRVTSAERSEATELVKRLRDAR